MSLEDKTRDHQGLLQKPLTMADLKITDPNHIYGFRDDVKIQKNNQLVEGQFFLRTDGCFV